MDSLNKKVRGEFTVAVKGPDISAKMQRENKIDYDKSPDWNQEDTEKHAHPRSGAKGVPTALRLPPCYLSTSAVVWEG